MIDKKQIQVSSLVEQIHSRNTKYFEFNLPSTAQRLEQVSVQKKEIRIIEGTRSLKFDTSLNLRLVYVEQETLALKQYGLTLNSTVVDPHIKKGEGYNYITSLDPDTWINFSLVKPNFVAVQAKLHVVTKVFSNELYSMEDQKGNSGEIFISIKEEGLYNTPSDDAITVSLEN